MQDTVGRAVFNLWFNKQQYVLVATLPFILNLKCTDYAAGLRLTLLKVTYSVHTMAGDGSNEYNTGKNDIMCPFNLCISLRRHDNCYCFCRDFWAVGLDYPNEFTKCAFGHMPRDLIALSPKPKLAIKEKLCRQLVSLAALERLEPGKHVALAGQALIVSHEVERGASSLLHNLDAEEGRANPTMPSGAEEYNVHNDVQ